ncbi:MAG: type IV toxin-antitoxin system AbiEi family antitoxin domain-containing protein [Bradymonadaceae bacterium]
MSTFDKIADVAKYQAGYVATYQVDVSRQMFSHHESIGRLERVIAGIYRLNSFPISEDEDHITAYLWSREKGVISHQTALSLHELSDVLPKTTEITLPKDEALPPQEPPGWVRVHRGTIPDGERQWYHNVPITTPGRTLIDLAMAGLHPDLLRQALNEARARRLVAEDFEWRIIHELITGRGKG